MYHMIWGAISQLWYHSCDVTASQVISQSKVWCHNQKCDITWLNGLDIWAAILFFCKLSTEATNVTGITWLRNCKVSRKNLVCSVVDCAFFSRGFCSRDDSDFQVKHSMFSFEAKLDASGISCPQAGGFSRGPDRDRDLETLLTTVTCRLALQCTWQTWKCSASENLNVMALVYAI